MTEQPSINEVQRRAPWSPMSVSLMTLLLSPGGAVLTIRNLHRLGEIDTPTARRLAFTIVFVFGIGEALLLLAARKAAGPPRTDANVLWFVSAVTAAGSYLAQRLPFRSWRARHASVPTSSWLTGAPTVVIYGLIAYLLASLVIVIAASIGLTPPFKTT